jgi:hypothetical protein
VLQILAVVGDLNDCRVLHDEIIEYAKRNGIGLITAYGRRGWMPDAKKHDWKVKTISYLYHREL